MFGKNVESVMKVFNTALMDLQVISEQRSVELSSLAEKQAVAEAERDKADRIISKLEDLLK